MTGEGRWTKGSYDLIERFVKAMKEPEDDPQEQTIVRVHTENVIILKRVLEIMGAPESKAQERAGCHLIACLNLIFNTSLCTAREVDVDELNEFFGVPGGRPYETLEKILKDTNAFPLPSSECLFIPRIRSFPMPNVYWCSVDKTFDIHKFFEQFIQNEWYNGGGILSLKREGKPNHALAFVKRDGTCVFLDDSPDDEKKALVTSPERARKQRFEYDRVELDSHGIVRQILLYQP